MKKIILVSLLSTVLFSCSEKKAETATSTPEVKKENNGSAIPQASSNVGTPATTQVEKIPGAKKTGVNIDKNPQFMVDGSQISSLSYKGEKGNSEVSEMYYLQKEANIITLTQVQVTRGEGSGLNKSVYVIDVNQVDAKELNVEQVKDKRYPNGSMYMINISCKSGTNCMNHTYEDIGAGKPVVRRETLTQIAFEKKEDADKYLAILKAEIK